MHEDIANALPALCRGGGVCSRQVWFFEGFGGQSGGAWAAHGCLVVGEDVLEADVRVGHAYLAVLGIEDLDKLGGGIAHFGSSSSDSEGEKKVPRW